MSDITLTDETINAIAKLTRLTLAPFDHPQGGKAVVLPDGTIKHLEEIDRKLTRVRQAVALLGQESFIHYVNRFKLLGMEIGAALTGEGDAGEPVYGEKTTIFADHTNPRFRAIIDYHDGSEPDYLAHVAEYAPPYSEQWQRWRAIDGKPMSQTEFAEFIEENAVDIVEPAGAVFLDLVTGLQAKKKVSFESGIRLADGTNQLTYVEEIETKGRNTMSVPAEFAIGVPIFFGGEGYKVRCLLRYRISEGGLTFIVKLSRRLFLEQTAFNDIAKAIEEATQIKVLAGWADSR